MGVGRLLKTAIKIAPVAYPIIRKMMKNKKSSGTADTSKYKTKQTRR